MSGLGLPDSFVASVLMLATESQGAFELLELWIENDGKADERDEIVADLQEMIDDAAVPQGGGQAFPRIGYEKLRPVVAEEILAFKRQLRETIDKHGGVSAVAQKTGIPQPSLSRMLNSASMPRQTTLYRIANALDLDESEVATKWRR